MNRQLHMGKITTHLSIFTGLLFTVAGAIGQGPHFGGVQDMNIWYNPALKVNKVPLTYVSVRSVKYPNLISYTSKALTIELPLFNKQATDYDNISFMNLAAGIGTDNSDGGFMNASTAMLALSYAMPLDNDNTYFAMGFQGNYSFNRIGTGNSYRFPDQFDKNGALNWSRAMDPYETGFNFGYLTAGVGVTLFHIGEQKQWYVGGSVRYFNHPYTEWSYSVRLPSNNGIQVGYSAPLSSLVDISGYGNITWQPGANEQFIGIRVIRHLSDSTNKAISVGVGYRAYDAVVPDACLQIGKSKFSLYYEINISKIPSGDYHRRAFEISYRYNF